MSERAILGIAMSNHDRAACLVVDGEPVAAIGEERIDRRKRSEGFYRRSPRHLVLPPVASVTYVLDAGGRTLADIDLVVCGRSLTLCRDVLLRYLPVAPERVVEPELPGHHLAHAYSAYAASPADHVALLVLDEQGHTLPGGGFEKCTWFTGAEGVVTPVHRFFGSSGDLSLGMLYDAFAALTGLSEAGMPSAGKLMGLAAHGQRRPEWPPVVELRAGGETRIAPGALDDLFALAGLPAIEGPRAATLDDLLARFRAVHWSTRLAADLARKAQDELEAAVLHVARALRAAVDAPVLAYAGGVALNCHATTRLHEAGWDDVCIQPAATDDGIALGLAMYGWAEVLSGRRRTRSRPPLGLGRRYGDREQRAALAAYGLAGTAEDIEPAAAAAERVAAGGLVCWFQGRSEWGPRALGARSVVADPLRDGVAERLNAGVKHREAFRPFGIAGTRQALAAALDLTAVPAALEPLMVAVAPLRDDRLRSVCHADGTVRFQVVLADEQPLWHELCVRVGERTGLEAVVNTSFNAFGEPLVESPDDAVRHFVLFDADALVLGRWLVAREAIPLNVLRSARERAWSLTAVDPLELALSLEAAGHPAAAAAVLEERSHLLDEREGTDRARRLAALRQRQAESCGDRTAARRAAVDVLAMSELPREALEAADLLARPGGSTAEQHAAAAIRRTGSRGAALDFFLQALEPQ